MKAVRPWAKICLLTVLILVSVILVGLAIPSVVLAVDFESLQLNEDVQSNLDECFGFVCQYNPFCIEYSGWPCRACDNLCANHNGELYCAGAGYYCASYNCCAAELTAMQNRQ